MIKFIFQNTSIKIKILSLPKGKDDNFLQNYENIYPINDNKNYNSAIETNKTIDRYLNNSINNKSKNINKQGCIYVDKHYNTRVLLIIVEHEGIEKYGIIDTRSNISCIDISLINDTELVKKEEDIIITVADNTKLEQLGKIKLMGTCTLLMRT